MLGIDYGEKRIGLALTDPTNRIAGPLKTIPNDELLAKNLQSIINENNVGKIVVGVPVNLKGEYGYEAGIVFEFIEKVIEPLGLPVVKIDERFTSSISAGIFSGQKKYNTGKKKKSPTDKEGDRKSGNIDKISAAVILNDYLTMEEFKQTQKTV